MAFTPRSDSLPTIGTRGTHTYSTEELPKGYREGILTLFPNGKATLTGLLSRAKKVRETQSHYMWFEKEKAIKGVAATPVGTTVSAGDSVNIGITTGFMNMIRIGHQVLLRDTDDHSKDLVLKVTNVTRTSNPTIDATVITDSGNVSTCDRLMIIGNLNPEGSVRPASISYNGYERDNYQQIWRDSLSLTRTAMKNSYRIGDVYKEAKLEAWQDHAEAQEAAFLWGIKGIDMGDNGQPERRTGGMINELLTYAPDNVIDAARINAYSGQDFVDFGLELLEEGLIKNNFLWGEDSEKIVLAGNAVYGAIAKVVRDNSQYNITNGEKRFGINVTILETPYGVWNLHKYTPFNIEPSLQHSILSFSLDQLELRYTDDFHFEKDILFGKGGGSGVDALSEGFLTEAGIAFKQVKRAMYVSNFGLDSLI